MASQKENSNPAVVTGKSFTAVAINTAAKAGEWIKSKLGSYGQLSLKTSAQDLVTEVDKGSEKMIRNLISTHFPHHTFLGEESVGQTEEEKQEAIARASEAEYVWVVDPVDGTTNFVHGFPFFSVSIALAHKGEIIVGVVYDPSRDELFVAEKGKGAYVHGNKMKVSRESELAQCLIASGFPVDQQKTLPPNMRGLQALAPQVRNIRTSGSAALHMAYVAAGRLSGFYELGLNAWDTAAGAILIQEAGGKVTDTLGNPYRLSTRHTLASNGIVHSSLLEVIKQADAQG
ncbi:inositol monophosphatase family protein [Marinicrinis lubricantis]|uniref:Inositol-1-monophosphatase n=1 Tax=Marinicrinis lubricantis TaxID=2086470 RepID=A0ABW1IJ76_9BACL